MKIICGYADDGLRPETRASILRYAPDTEFLDFTGDDFAYWKAIKERWTGKEGLVVIEQDMVITEEIISSFRSCDKDWCSFGYTAAPHHGRVTACLGCTKFSAALQRELDLSTVNNGVDISWPEIDVNLAVALELHKFRPHDHGEVTHLHEYMPVMVAGLSEPGEFTSNEFCYFMPPSLCNHGNKALLEIPSGLLKDQIDAIIRGCGNG